VVHYALRDNVTNEQGQMIKATSITYSVGSGTPKTVKGSFYGADLFRATIPAQAAGAVVSYKLSATDRAGNIGYSAALTYTVPTPAPPPVVVGVGGSGGFGGSTPIAGSGGASAGTGGATGGTGGGGEAGAAEGGEAGEPSSAGGKTSVGGASPSTGGKPGGKAGSSSSVAGSGEAGEPTGSAGKGHYETVDEGGCAVSTATPATQGRGAALLGLGLAMLGLVRRRRNSKQ
jgi:MYXO-CTERM domain-containing protein